MKIDKVRVYQPVYFEGRARTTFVSIATTDRETPLCNIIQDQYGVLVYTNKCAVRVGWPNIASLEYDHESFMAAIEPQAKLEKEAKSKKA